MNNTDSQSFILKPSTIPNGGVGVFMLHDVAEGTMMELFTPEFFKEERTLDRVEVPAELQGYCLELPDGKLQCPGNFSRMDIGNYLNHSDHANLRWDEHTKSYFAARDIKAGEEIFSDYRQLEPDFDSREYTSK